MQEGYLLSTSEVIVLVFRQIKQNGYRSLNVKYPQRYWNMWSPADVNDLKGTGTFGRWSLSRGSESLEVGLELA